MPPAQSAQSAPPRSLADELRRWDADALSSLLRERPDLATPLPPDIAALAGRAGSAGSTARILDRLDRFTLEVAEVLAALSDPTTLDDVLIAFPEAVAGPVADRVARLRRLALVWGDAAALHLVRTVREGLGTYPAGLGPALSDVRPLLADATRIAALLDEAPSDARAVLDRLAWGPPVGNVPDADRPVSPESARTPVEWLLARDLLVATGPTTVVLPREVARVLRRTSGRPLLLRDPAYPPSELSPGAAHDPAAVDRTAGHHAHLAITAVTELLESWSEQPPVVLRKGGLAMRDLALAARTLDTDETSTALWIEVAHMAGLLGRDGEADEAWRPTGAFDDWCADEPGQRWAVLVVAWLTSTRVPALVRGIDADIDPVNPLSEDAVIGGHPALRRRVLDILATLPNGVAPADVPAVSGIVDEQLPRSATPLRRAHIAALVREAEALGVTGMGALSTAGRRLVGPAADDIEVALARRVVLPAPVDHILVQADLTAVAPGPLVPALAREMRLLADVESTGGATVFRFTAESIRRGLEAGRTPAAIQALLQGASRTPIPQPLTYLIEDAARQLGSIQIGAAGSYVTCADPAAAQAILADRRARDRGVVGVSSTVLISPLAPAELAALLRDIGHPVTLEEASAPPRGHERARRSPPVRPPVTPSGPDGAVIDAAARALAASASGDLRRDSPAPPDLPPMPAAETLAALKQAVSASEPVWIAYADAEPTVVDPLRLRAGLFTGLDLSTGTVRTFAVPRVSAVRRA